MNHQEINDPIIERNDPEEKPKKLILRFKDSEKVDGIPNESFYLLITTTIANFDMSRILIDGGSLCNIMYAKIF